MWARIMDFHCTRKGVVYLWVYKEHGITSPSVILGETIEGG